jgi:hypothetical protein
MADDDADMFGSSASAGVGGLRHLLRSASLAGDEESSSGGAAAAAAAARRVRAVITQPYHYQHHDNDDEDDDDVAAVIAKPARSSGSAASSFAARRRRRHLRHSSLFDDDDEPDEDENGQDASASPTAAVGASASAAASHSSAASSLDATAAASSASAPLSSSSSFSSASSSGSVEDNVFGNTTAAVADGSPLSLLPPVDEELAAMLESFSPALQQELRAATADGPASPPPALSALSSASAVASLPFFATSTLLPPSARSSLGGGGNGGGASGSNGGGSSGRQSRGAASLFSDLFSDDEAASGIGDGNGDKVAVADRIYSVWEPSDSDSSSNGGVPTLHALRIRLTSSELQTLQPGSERVAKAFAYADVFCVTGQEGGPTNRSLVHARVIAEDGTPVDDTGAPFGASSSRAHISADGVVRSVSISFISDVEASFETPDALALSADLQERISQRSSAELDGTSSANTTTAAAAATGATSAPSGVAVTSDVPDGLALSYQEKLLGTDSRPTTASALDSASTAPSSSAAAASIGSSSSADQSATTATTAAPFFSPRTTANPADTTGRSSRKKSATPPISDDGDKTTASAAPPPPVVDPTLLAWQRKYALDQRVQSLIDLLWLDPHSEEGKARSKFLRAFPGLEAKPEALLAATRKFLDSFRTYMERKRIDVLRKRIVGDPVAAVAANASPDTDQLSLAEFESSFHARVERSAEVAVLLPILPRLHASLATVPPERGGTRDADALVARQCALLRSKWSQAEFGISLRHHSPSAWSAASRELRQIELFDLPCDKLEVLLGTAKAIYQTFKIESQAKLMKQKAEEAAAVNGAVSSAAVSSSSSLFLPGDEFFPIFTFVLAHTPLRVGIVSLKHALWGLADPAALQGEAGYYLTVFDAAIEFVRTADPNTPVDLTVNRTEGQQRRTKRARSETILRL